MPQISKDPLIGKVLGNCRLLKKIGEGGMGAVYQAHHIGLNKMMAVKILPPTFSRDEERVKRFIREARAAAKLEHHNIVQTLNIGKQEGLYFIIMQYVQGESLDVMIKRKRKLSMPEATRIIKESAVALSVAHQQNIIHRDVKPENIMLTLKGEVKLMDFGLARVMDEVSNLSRTGDIMGTPHYLAPEQAHGQKVDARCDIYALGVTYYHALTGSRPFEGTTPMTVILKHLNAQMPDPHQLTPDLRDSVCQVLKKMTAKKPGQRYQSMAELIRVLETLPIGQVAASTQPAGVPVPGSDVQTITYPSRKPDEKNKKLIFYVTTAVAGLIVFIALLISFNGNGTNPDNGRTETPVVNPGSNGNGGDPVVVEPPPPPPSPGKEFGKLQDHIRRHPREFEKNIDQLTVFINKFSRSDEAGKAKLIRKDIKREKLKVDLKRRAKEFVDLLRLGQDDQVLKYVHGDQLEKHGEENLKKVLKLLSMGLLLINKSIVSMEIDESEIEIQGVPGRRRGIVTLTVKSRDRSGKIKTEKSRSKWRLSNGTWYFWEGEKKDRSFRRQSSRDRK